MKKILALLFSLCACAAQAQIVGTLPFQLQNGTTADATQVMADFNKILADTNANAAKNGVNGDITALTALITPITPVQGGSSVSTAATSTGTANAQIIASPTPTGFTLATGRRITFMAGFTNTGATQINVNSTGLKDVFRQTPSGAVALSGGEIAAGNYIEAVYDGTQYQLYTNAVDQSIGPLTNIASAATTDIGTIGSHNVNITGVTGITAFGSTAIAAWPYYKLTFAGVLTLTHNATSLILPGGVGITTAANDVAEAMYLGSGNWRVITYTRATGVFAINPALVQNYLSGLTLSAAGGSGSFGIAVGVATDSTNVSSMVLPSAYAKGTGSWAVGSATGALDSGSISPSVWYHVFLIQRPDTSVVDVCVSATVTGCAAGVGNIPAAYTIKRRIGSMRTDGSSFWLPFTQTYDTFIWAAPFLDMNASTGTTSRVNTTLTVPTGVVVAAFFRAIEQVVGALSMSTVFASLQENDAAPGGSLADIAVTGVAANTLIAAGNFEKLTNTSAQIGVRSSTTNGTISVSTYGWKDTRGK